jgi:hypothetical protein
MQLDRDSVHFRMLEALCAMPRAVRGISAAMLERRFGPNAPIDDLVAGGLIRRRGWAAGPGWVWLPTAKGEALYQKLSGRPANGAAEPLL